MAGRRQVVEAVCILFAACKKSASQTQTVTKVPRKKAVKEEPKDTDNAEEVEVPKQEHLKGKKSSRVVVKQEAPLSPEISMLDETDEAVKVCCASLSQLVFLCLFNTCMYWDEFFSG